MNEELNKFLEPLKNSLGENLVSIVLYGSAARGGNISKFSDTNLMIVVKDLTLEKLYSWRGIINKAKNTNINPIFWTQDEVKYSTDIFPIEFLGIKENYEILAGEDVIKDIKIDTKNFRHQLEFELRSKLFIMRNEWINLKGSKAFLSDFLIRMGASFSYLFKYAGKLAGDKLSPALAEPFNKCVKLKKKEIKIGRSELENLYEQVYKSALEVTDTINDI